MKAALQYSIASPPSLPKKPREKIFLSFANFKVSMIFFELPEVEMANKVSPFEESAEKTLLKTSSDPKSFMQAVRVEVS